MLPAGFKGAARPLSDQDIARVAHDLGVGEDRLHAVIDVESRGRGFDQQGRPIIQFEPHVFHRLLKSQPMLLERAIASNVAYAAFRPGSYKTQPFDKLATARAIHSGFALQATSWGLGQIMGFNFRAAGFDSVEAMVAAACESEYAQLEMMASFIRANPKMHKALVRGDYDGFAAAYNGPAYAANRYAERLREREAWWAKHPDTPYAPSPASPGPATPPSPASPGPAAPPSPASPGPATPPAPAPVEPVGFWARFFRAIAKRIRR